MECYKLQRWQKLGYQILTEIEDLLGKRQLCHFAGFFEGEKEYPYFEYYDTTVFETSAIYLTKGLKKASHAAFEISHEVIHLLTPVSSVEITNFEEGVATFFSLYYLELIGEKEYAKERMNFLKSNSNYLGAYNSVKDIQDLFIRIKNIKENEPTLKLSRFKNEHFQELTGDISLIKYWSTKFEN